MNGQRLARRIRNRNVRIIARLEQIIRDVEWWNTHRRDAPSFDCEWARVALARSRRELEAWDRGDHVEAFRLCRENVKALQEDGNPYGMSELPGSDATDL